ncbi:MAG TPA: hypothetical protein VGL77_14850 [Armatimonadota bacterium]|jgi:hypothetical protein
MRLHPVKRPVAPVYPNRAALDARPELLRAVPKRWQTNIAVLTTLAGLGLLAAPELLSGATGKTESPVVARVAPVFPLAVTSRARLMGDVAMPRFLSEEEARTIIEDEASKAGITFKPDVQQLKKVPLPSLHVAQDGHTTSADVDIDLTFDGTDTQRHISYEVVTKVDIDGWRAQHINLPDDPTPAMALRDGITQGIPAGTYAVFYDPATAPGFASEDLRRQVRDFVTWLKAQGVI